MSEAFLALIGAIFGGVGLKVIEQILSRKKLTIDAATQYRDELRKDIELLRIALRDAEQREYKWRQKYYSLLDERHRDEG